MENASQGAVHGAGAFAAHCDEAYMATSRACSLLPSTAWQTAPGIYSCSRAALTNSEQRRLFEQLSDAKLSLPLQVSSSRITNGCSSNGRGVLTAEAAKSNRLITLDRARHSRRDHSGVAVCHSGLMLRNARVPDCASSMTGQCPVCARA